MHCKKCYNKKIIISTKKLDKIKVEIIEIYGSFFPNASNQYESGIVIVLERNRKSKVL